MEMIAELIRQRDAARAACNTSEVMRLNIAIALLRDGAKGPADRAQTR